MKGLNLDYFLSGFVLYLVKCRTMSPTCEVTWESWISTNREKQRVNNREKQRVNNREKQRVNNRETSVLSLFCVCNLTFHLE